jgi:hypothetical protein
MEPITSKNPRIIGQRASTQIVESIPVSARNRKKKKVKMQSKTKDVFTIQRGAKK